METKKGDKFKVGEATKKAGEGVKNIKRTLRKHHGLGGFESKCYKPDQSRTSRLGESNDLKNEPVEGTEKGKRGEHWKGKQTV